jgi:hypothetical protein
MNYKKQTEKLYKLRREISNIIEDKNNEFKDVDIDDLWSVTSKDYKLYGLLRLRVNTLCYDVSMLSFAYQCFVNSGEIQD